MTRFMITMTGLLFLAMAGLAMANPAMLPTHPGYPAGGEVANDTGRKNFTYSQSMEEAAKSGDTIMGARLIDAKNFDILKFQFIDPFKRPVELPLK